MNTIFPMNRLNVFHRMSLTVRALFAVVALVAGAVPALAIQGGREVPSAERSLEAVAQFTRVQWQDLPGALGNAVLVAPDRVLIPRHLINQQFTFQGSVDLPPELFIVRFRRNVDGTLGDPQNPASYLTIRIVGFSFLRNRDEGADAVIAVLERPVRHIEPISVDFNRKLAPGTRVQIVSWGQQQAQIEVPTDGRAQPARLRQGEIILKSWDRRLLEIDTDTTARNLATVVSSDSGAGLFVLSGGKLRLIGIATRQSGGVSIAQLRDITSFFPGRGLSALSTLGTPYTSAAASGSPPPDAPPPVVVTAPRPQPPQSTTTSRQTSGLYRR
jgi:hypothetical protein